MSACSRFKTNVSVSSDDAAYSSRLDQPEIQITNSWDQKAAAAYLDRREAWWMEWPVARRDHQTFCVSCHTTVPYALSRPALRRALAEQVPSDNEVKLLENVRTRVHLWNDSGPYYSDRGDDLHKTAESRGTEAILNALILASNDAQNGHLSAEARAAFDNLWVLQDMTGDNRGAWGWLEFGLEPWEAKDSQYYGAILAAIAVGIAPENYRSMPGIQNNLRLLSQYLNRELAAQSTINRVVLLWASAKLPGLLKPKQQESIVREVLSKQRGDGGWSLSSLAWPRHAQSLSSIFGTWLRQDGTWQEFKSDAYATGLITFALQEVDIPRENVQLKRGLSWLVHNQNKSQGLWLGYSLNRQRNVSSQVGQFMNDAATAYAVLALTEGDKH